jgi:hypothetical protein
MENMTTRRTSHRSIGVRHRRVLKNLGFAFSLEGLRHSAERAKQDGVPTEAKKGTAGGLRLSENNVQ